MKLNAKGWNWKKNKKTQNKLNNYQRNEDNTKKQMK
jgi:hypothetical protein